MSCELNLDTNNDGINALEDVLDNIIDNNVRDFSVAVKCVVEKKQDISNFMHSYDIDLTSIHKLQLKLGIEMQNNISDNDLVKKLSKKEKLLTLFIHIFNTVEPDSSRRNTDNTVVHTQSTNTSWWVYAIFAIVILVVLGGLFFYAYKSSKTQTAPSSNYTVQPQKNAGGQSIFYKNVYNN
jgi:hypothetical protein